MIVEAEGKGLKRKRKLSDSVSEQIQADNMEASGQNHNMHGSLSRMDVWIFSVLSGGGGSGIYRKNPRKIFKEHGSEYKAEVQPHHS